MASTTARHGGLAAKNTPTDDQTSNGVIPHNTTPAGIAVNRKKAKRRAKQAAKQNASYDQTAATDDMDSEAGHRSSGHLQPPGSYAEAYNGNMHYEEGSYADPDPSGGFVYSDEEDQYPYDTRSQVANGDSNYGDAIHHSRGKGKQRKKHSGSVHDHHAPGEHGKSSVHHAPYNHGRPQSGGAPRGISDDALRTVQRGINNGIWNTSSVEERQRIKEYWLSLGENERKALVKIEKNDVLKKMKDQQKHSCSCTVCGRKRVAIEEELEVLYDAYYQELEQYANHNQQFSENGTTMLPPARRYANLAPKSSTNGLPPPVQSRKGTRGRVEELPDDQDEEDLDDEELDDEEEYSEEDYDDAEYSGDEQETFPPEANEFFTFGKSLTVKGGILTVADDLLKNDGQKFIDMMEQLAERRLQRDDQSMYQPQHPNYAPGPPQHTHSNNGHLQPEEDEYDEEDDEEYDSQDEDYDEEDEVDTMTEVQRMDEGRRMFQIFAARMFEQRVLTAYREKRAMERTQAFLEDLEAEESAKAEAGAKNAAKKAKQRQKEKAKKEALKEEKARKADEKAAAEAAEEQRKQDEKRRKDEENRKKEEERKRKIEATRIALEEEKQRKKAEEREREESRKLREQKAREKREREEAIKKEHETKEREKKVQQEKDERDKREQAKAEKEAQDKIRKAEQAAQAQAAKAALLSETQQPAVEVLKRAPLSAIVALPPSLKSKPSYTSHDSPLTKIATPAIPKPPTPVRPKELSRGVSQNSTPLSPETAPRSKHSTPPKPVLLQSAPPPTISMPRMRTPSQTIPTTHTPLMSPIHNIAPPPGMHPQNQGVPHIGMPHMGANGFPGAPGQMMPGMMQHRMPLGHQMPMYPPHIQQMGPHHRPYMHAPIGGAPPGISLPLMPQPGRPYAPEPVSGVNHGLQTPIPGAIQQPYPNARENMPPQHSRQPSMSLDAPSPPEGATPSGATQPIMRPAPIKRPGSVKPQDGDSVDELSTRLGSSALLDDNDEPLVNNRRTSVPLGMGMPNSSSAGFVGSPFDHMQSPFSLGTHSGLGDNWRSPASQYGPPSASGWGSTLSNSGWGSTGGFNPAMHHRASNPRPITVRLLVCQACRTLSHQTSGVDGGFHDFKDIVRIATESARQMHEVAVHPHEVRNILDTEGDAQNGGGSFVVRNHVTTARTLVKWVPEVPEQGIGGGRTGLGLGEIGSPLPGHSIPALGGLGLGARGF